MGSGGGVKYKGSMDCFIQVMKNEGFNNVSLSPSHTSVACPVANEAEGTCFEQPSSCLQICGTFSQHHFNLMTSPPQTLLHLHLHFPNCSSSLWKYSAVSKK